MRTKTSKIGFYLLAIFATMTLTVACSSDNDNDGPTPPTEEELTLQGSLSTEKILLTGNTYKLEKGYHVKAGGSLVIQKGVTIEGQELSDDPDYILIEQGGKILAEGTKDQPIVMTSKTKEAGAWGGVHICGKAPINLQGPRINSVGINGINNVVEQVIHSLDFISVYSLNSKMKIKFQAKNILNYKNEFTQEVNGKDEIVEHYKRGVSLSVGFSMNF